MGWLTDQFDDRRKPLTPEQKRAAKQERREAKKREKAERQRQLGQAAAEAARAKKERLRAKLFARTPAGLARQAAEAGQIVFQYIDTLAETKPNVVPMAGAESVEGTQGLAGDKQARNREKLRRFDSRHPIEQVESEGWELLDTGYTFQPTITESRDKFLASGQQEAIGGRVLGIYTFRRSKAQPP